MKKIIGFIIEVLTCRQKIKQLEKDRTSPDKIIELLMNKGLDWYDYDKLDFEDRLKYYNDAQRVLTNSVFENEVKHFLGDLIQEIAVSDADYNKDKVLRYSINGVKTLIERLESIPDPRTEDPTKDDIHNYV